MHIEMSHVYKKYNESNISALEDVSFIIEAKHRMIAIKGHNGAGKSTLLNLLAAVDTPDSGSIFIDNKDITKLTRDELANYRLFDIGIVFQSINLLPTFNIYENIAIPGYLAGLNRKTLKKEIEELVEKVGIQHLLKQYPHEISSGEKQRAAIVRALINKPKLILADEPTGNLDTHSATDLYVLLHELTKTAHVTVIVVTHDERMVKYADKVIKMENGRISA